MLGIVANQLQYREFTCNDDVLVAVAVVDAKAPYWRGQSTPVEACTFFSGSVLYNCLSNSIHSDNFFNINHLNSAI